MGRILGRLLGKINQFNQLDGSGLATGSSVASGHPQGAATGNSDTATRGFHPPRARPRGHPAYAKSSGFSGRRRRRFLVSAKSAFVRAGATGGTPGSPTPVDGSVLGTMCTSTKGISF